MSAKGFFTKKQRSDIVYTIKRAEVESSCEIRVHIESNCDKKIEWRAAEMFHELGIPRTHLRNGLLFYFAVNKLDLAIIGDEGINKNVGKELLSAIRNIALEKFEHEKYAEGIEEAILECGHQLKKYFPIERTDVNELIDEITFS